MNGAEHGRSNGGEDRRLGAPKASQAIKMNNAAIAVPKSVLDELPNAAFNAPPGPLGGQGA